MIVLCGKSCSGKDSIGRELEKLGVKKTITYTTRPIREGEVDGKHYNFITEDKFKILIENNFFAEYREYETVNGVWFYGSAKKDYTDVENKYIILTLSGLTAIKQNKILSTSFYIDCKDDVILERMGIRDNSSDESKRRFLSDKKDFDNIIDKVDFVVSNNGDILNLKQLAEIIYYANIGKSLIK